MKIDPAIKEDLKLRLKEDLNKLRQRVFVTSAYKIGDEEKKQLFSKYPILKDRPVEYFVDEKILAGYRIQVGSKVTDISLKGQLQNFKNRIYEINR